MFVNYPEILKQWLLQIFWVFLLIGTGNREGQIQRNKEIEIETEIERDRFSL